MYTVNFNENTERQRYEDIEIPQECELRVNQSPRSKIVIKVIDGVVEFFGAPFTTAYYEIPSEYSSFYLYGVTKAVVRVFWQSECTPEYYIQRDDDGTRSFLIGLNYVLDCFRKTAKLNWSDGPRVLVAGGANAGKSTIIRTLANFAARNENEPIVADIDSICGDVAYPGTIAAISFKGLMPHDFSEIHKIAYGFGKASISDNFEHYIECVRSLLVAIKNKQEYEKKGLKELLAQRKILTNNYQGNDFSSGVIFNIPNTTNKLTTENIKQLIDSINPNFILVVQDDSFLAKVRAVANQNCHIIRRGALSGVMQCDTDRRQRRTAILIHRYFYSDSMSYVYENIPLSSLYLIKIDSIKTSPLNYLSQDQSGLRITLIEPRVVSLKDKRLLVLNIKNGLEANVKDIIASEIGCIAFVQQCTDAFLSIIRPRNLEFNIQNRVIVVSEM